MSEIHGGHALAQTARLSADEARLRQAARQMEGVFVQQLLKAMRETVPDEGLARGGMGEEIFTALLDQQVADTAAGRWERGLGMALYRQLRERLQPSPSAAVEP